MRDTRVAHLFRIRDRFLRSVHLERDFRDPAAMRGYIVTPHARVGLNRLASGLAADSGQRAWRITGDYGSGKSSFALALAHLFSGKDAALPESLRQVVDFRRVGARPQLLPVLVTGSREPIASAMVTALARALEDLYGRGKPPKVLERARAMAATVAKTPPADAAVLSVLAQASTYLNSSGKAAGLLIILDELGKLLEYAALRPDRQDVYFLQRLAEAASRSGASPLFVVGLLHQGFNAYADHLSESAQREWEKVAGRFEEFLFNQPLEQTAVLAADAMSIRVDKLPGAIVRQAHDAMEAAFDLGWYGPAASRKSLLDLAVRLYPLHPTVLPVLARLFHRFGQNERSLFSFLLSTEPSGLRAFAEQSLEGAGFYRLHHLYDYARACFGHRLSTQSYRSHWNHIDSVVESFPAEADTDLQVLKTIGLLNLLDAPPFLASDRALDLALGAGGRGAASARSTVQRLQKDKRVLYYRGAAGGYCLWPHTSVNLEQAYRDADRALAPAPRVASLVEGTIEPRPLVARRHYIETGNLRHFRVRYVAVPDLSSALGEDLGNADGLILVALCETAQERDDAMEFARSGDVTERSDVLMAVPAPLSSLRGLVQETQRWEWVAQHVPELGNDRYAAEEVSRQVAASRRSLRERVHAVVGLGRAAGQTELKWFRQGRGVPMGDGRDLLTRLSTICDERFAEAPRVRNELLNRHDLSSAAAAARMRLIDRMLSSPTSPLLGMDPARKPPEMSMYLSVLQAGGLHRETREGFAILEPPASHDPLNLRPALNCIRQVLTRHADRRVPVSEVFEALTYAPYGVRAGLAPLLLAVTAIVHEQEIAFYEDGAFVRRLSGETFHRLMKSPGLFEVQYCKVGGVRATLFMQLARLLATDAGPDAHILSVVRPLCLFAAQLPAYTHKTRRLSPAAVAVRDALVAAKEPATLLFTDLPTACGFSPFRSRSSPDEREVTRFVGVLKDVIDELKTSYGELLRRMQEVIQSAFDRPGAFPKVRDALADTADRLLVALAEPRLKALCLRLLDRQLPETEWLESLGSFVCSKPPSKWLDIDAEHFREELDRLAQQFRRVEATATAFATAGGSALRVAITLPDGTDMERVVHLDANEEEQAREVEDEVTALLSVHSRVGIAAATRAIWKQLSSYRPAGSTPRT